MKTTLLSLSLLLIAKLTVSAGIDLGSATARTPYDPYMGPVKHVFSTLHGENLDMERVNSLMRQGRGFRYSHTDPYNPALPQETAARHLGDCKDKALWLCDQLQDPSARFVIGKMKRSSSISHAWVMWQHEGRWWILDCTMNYAPVLADKVATDDYVPLYSYSKGVSYRHTGGSSSLATVAGKAKTPVASRGDRLVAAN